MSDHILDALQMAAPYGPQALEAVERYIRSLSIDQPVSLLCVKLVINSAVGSQVYIITETS
jgi:hypothetical protein